MKNILILISNLFVSCEKDNAGCTDGCNEGPYHSTSFFLENGLDATLTLKFYSKSHPETTEYEMIDLPSNETATLRWYGTGLAIGGELSFIPALGNNESAYDSIVVSSDIYNVTFYNKDCIKDNPLCISSYAKTIIIQSDNESTTTEYLIKLEE